MKKVMKKGIVLVMLFTMLCSNATEVSSLKNLEDGKTTLILNNVKIGEQLIIQNELGIILYKELISKDGNYSKGFDLTNLPDGNYNFELDKQMQIKIIPFRVNSSIVVFSKVDEVVINKPHVRVKDQHIFITKLALKKEPLEIELYYENENDFELIHSETIKEIIQIERVYKLLKDIKGDYKLVFKTQGRTFEKIINI